MVYRCFKGDSSLKAIPFISILTLIFVALKVSGAITWPWVWVLSPLWLALCMAAGIVVGVVIVVAGIEIHYRFKKEGKL